jgi:hypothetical protein
MLVMDDDRDQLHMSNTPQKSENISNRMSALWLKADLRSKCEYLKPSHLLIEGCTLEIGLGKTKYSLNVYLTTKKNSATLERARARTSQKRTRAADF